MGKLRWGDAAPADQLDARRRLVRAALVCLDRYGLAKTTVEDVATEASVSRATVYRYFANRDELLLAALLAELEHSLDRSLGDFLAEAGPGDAGATAAALVDAAVYLLEVIRANARLRALLAHERSGVSATLSGASAALFGQYAAEVGPELAAAQRAGRLRDDLEAEDLAEWLLRAILSLLTVEGPGEGGPERERQLLTAFVAPVLLPAASRAVAADGRRDDRSALATDVA